MPDEMRPLVALGESEVAARLGLSVATLRAWRLTGKGPRFVRFGRAVRYLLSDVENYVQAALQQPAQIPTETSRPKRVKR